MLKIGPTLLFIGKVFLIPMQVFWSTFKLFSLTPAVDKINNYCYRNDQIKELSDQKSREDNDKAELYTHSF